MARHVLTRDPDSTIVIFKTNKGEYNINFKIQNGGMVLNVTDEEYEEFLEAGIILRELSQEELDESIRRDTIGKEADDRRMTGQKIN
jgi:hypothetical protein